MSVCYRQTVILKQKPYCLFMELRKDKAKILHFR